MQQDRYVLNLQGYSQAWYSVRKPLISQENEGVRERIKEAREHYITSITSKPRLFIAGKRSTLSLLFSFMTGLNNSCRSWFATHYNILCRKIPLRNPMTKHSPRMPKIK
jgi:hypothetical protein